MRMQVIPGAPAQEVVKPSGGASVPEGFINGLKMAAKFVGKFDKWLADAQFVHVIDGKAYASNNRHIAEIDIGDTPFKSLRLSKSDVTLLTRIGTVPANASVFKDHAEFTWADGNWLRIEVSVISPEFIDNCRSRLDQYWREPESHSADPKSLDEMLEKTGKGKTVAIAAVGGRAVGKNDGFFFPTGKASLTSLFQDNRVDPFRDDLFSQALKETKEAQKKNAARIDRLRGRLRSIQDDINALEAENVEFEDKLVSQHEAIAAYQTGESLDEVQRVLLTPQCRDLVKDEKKQALQIEFEGHEDTIPDGWEVTGKRQDDDYIYVTIRRERVNNSKPVETAAAKVKRAFSLLFKPGFDRDFRIRWDQLGTLAPIMRGAP